MKKNIGTKDRILRGCLGALILAGAIYWKSWILLACALFCFIEAIFSWCLFYQLIGKNTCPISKGGK